MIFVLDINILIFFVDVRLQPINVICNARCYIPSFKATVLIDLELAIDPPPPPWGSFVHYDFLKLHYIRNKMTHVSPLYVGALTCNVNVNYTTQNYIFRLM